MTQDRDNEINLEAITAIREAVEERQRSMGALDDGILELDDIVWRSPARPVIDPTDTIARLAEEADKVARGVEVVPPQATVHHHRTGPDFGTRDRQSVRNPALDEAGAWEADPRAGVRARSDLMASLLSVKRNSAALSGNRLTNGWRSI